MNDASLAIAVAASLLGIASAIALTPVKRIQSWVAARAGQRSPDFSLHTDRQLPSPDESYRGTRQELVSTLMRNYLHDRSARDHLQAAAATRNLHPVDPEDVLTQLIFIRRDIHRILRESPQSKLHSSPATYGSYRSEYFHPIIETPAQRTDMLSVKYFQQALELYELESTRTVPSFHWKASLKRKSGAF